LTCNHGFSSDRRLPDHILRRPGHDWWRIYISYTVDGTTNCGIKTRVDHFLQRYRCSLHAYSTSIHTRGYQSKRGVMGCETYGNLTRAQQLLRWATV